MIKKITRRIKLLANDYRWWGFYFQRFFLKPVVRNRIATVVARRHPAAQLMNAHSQADSQALSSSGFVMLGEVLSPQACDELYRYFSQYEVYDSYRPGSPRFFPLDDRQRHPDAHVAHHMPLDVLRAPHLMRLANDPRILSIVSEFLGCKPTIAYLAVWWSYRTINGAQQAEFFHRDVDDWKFVKLFVYLTDVGLDNGPHMYVQHSSNSNQLTEIRRFTDDEVRAAFGEENLLTMTKTAGHGFLEDTFGIHKGQPIVKGIRLMFQAVYGLSQLPYSPKLPVMTQLELGVPNLDPWVNRVYLK